MTAAQIIREARLKAGLTQSQLAERLGRERAQVARWEIGGQEPSFENVVAVVEACGFALNVEIAERVDDPVLDAELTDERPAGTAATRPGAPRALGAADEHAAAVRPVRDPRGTRTRAGRLRGRRRLRASRPRQRRDDTRHRHLARRSATTTSAVSPASSTSSAAAARTASRSRPSELAAGERTVIDTARESSRIVPDAVGDARLRRAPHPREPREPRQRRPPADRLARRLRPHARRKRSRRSTQQRLQRVRRMMELERPRSKPSARTQHRALSEAPPSGTSHACNYA